MTNRIEVFELSQSFYFEAAHTLKREHETEGSLRIHGHTYEAQITVIGESDHSSGMVVDLALLRSEIVRIRELLDHQFLDEIDELGPATLENLARYISNKIISKLPNLYSVMVERRLSGDRCVYRLK
jgi:6-pyruvoyltetrahydropterin/6-carboxytetrahydropterin synthase